MPRSAARVVPNMIEEEEGPGSLLDRLKIDGRPIGDMTAGELNAWADAKEAEMARVEAKVAHVKSLIPYMPKTPPRRSRKPKPG